MKKIWITLIVLFGSIQTYAHEVRPALLKIAQMEEDKYEVTWKIPTINNMSPKIKPLFTSGFELVESGQKQSAGAFTTTYVVHYSDQLSGNKITIENLEQTLIDVVLLIELLDGTVHSMIIQADNPSVIIPVEPSFLEVIKDYTLLGVEHIWFGWDHLLFVLCLLLLITGFSKLVKTITAFTLAHSITLVLSTLQVVTLPGPPVEAIIALSIVFLAREYYFTLQGKESLTARSPWIVAFAFGLLHGFGFAGALLEIGLPQQQIVNSLLFFNLGIELGQVIFVIVMLAVAWLIKKIFTPNKKLKIYMTYSIGALASFWLIERIINF